MSFLFGSSGSPAQPYRGPGYEQQGDLLNQLLTGMAGGAFAPLQSQLNQQYQQAQNGLGDLQSQKQTIENVLNQPGLTGFVKQDFENQLADINSQIAQTTQQLQQSEVNQTSPYEQYYQGLEVPQLNFNVNSFDPEKAVGDSFTPQYEIAQRAAQEQARTSQEALQADLERRGLTTTGAAVESGQQLQSNIDDRLANVAAQLAAQQAQSQLGAYQFAQQSDLANQQAQNQALMNQYSMNVQNQAYADQQKQQAIANLMNLYGYSTGSTPATQGQPGLVQSVAAPLVQYGLSTLSDRRLKTKIKQIGVTEEGVPHVEFEYVNIPGIKYTGVIAQDAEKIVPESVIDKDGIKFVDYSKLSVDCERIN